MGVLEFVGNVHFWKRYNTTHADMEASSRRKEGRKESIEDLALLFTGVYRGSGAVVYSSQDREKEAGYSTI